MAYFSNGTEGMTYEETYCMRCLHYGDEEQGCPVWELHQIYNGTQLKDGKLHGPVAEILSVLIPMDPETHEAMKCSMFMPNGDCKGQLKMDLAAPEDRGGLNGLNSNSVVFDETPLKTLKMDLNKLLGISGTEVKKRVVRHWRECPLRCGDEQLGCGLTGRDDDCGTTPCLCNAVDFDPKCPLVINGQIVLVRGYKDG